MFLMGDAIAQTTPPPEEFTIARLKYRGGGDWYGDPSSLPNLLAFIRNNTNMRVAADEARVDITQPDLFSYPYLYLTGHGNVRFADEEVKRLRSYLTSGGFLHADDNYGMDFSFRRELKRIFPDKDLVDLPFSHPIYHAPFDFARGMPKIHKHDGKRARGLGIFHKGRLVVFYSYETDLGDGWEDAPVHGDPASKRLAALRMGTNIVVYALTH
jgi:hypothetical protein